MNFVCLVFVLGEKTLTLSPMENLMVKCNHQSSPEVCLDRLSPDVATFQTLGHVQPGRNMYINKLQS